MVVKKVGKLTLKKARLKDVEPIAESIRKSDREELRMLDVDPTHALIYPFTQKKSTIYTLFSKKKPIAMLGTGWDQTTKNKAQVWMLATVDLEDNYFSFLRGSRSVVDLLQEDYDKIYNYIPVHDRRTQQWLCFCGFEFETNIYNINNYQFIKFFRCNYKENSFINEESRPVMH